MAVAIVVLATACGQGDNDEQPTPDGDGDGDEQQLDDSTDGDEATDGDEPDGPVGDPVDLTFVSFAAEEANQSQAILWWAEEVERRSGGTITMDPHFSGSLIAAEDTLGAVAEGRADLGYAASFYHTSDLPLTSVAELPFVTRNADAQLRALMQLYNERDDFREEYDRNGVRVIFYVPTDVQTIATAEPFETLSDIEGLNIRAGGLASPALQAIGANPVAIAAPEIFEALQRGVIDGYGSLTLDFIPPFGLTDVTDYVTDAGLGQYAALPILMTQDVYEGMSDEQRAIVDEVGHEALGVSIERLLDAGEAACDELLDAGAQISILDEAEREEWSSVVRDDLIDDWIEARDADGHDGQGFFDNYMAALESHASASDYSTPVEGCAERSS